MTHNPLTNDFNMRALLKYTLPSIFAMVFLSTYTVIDGVFVSNLVGEDALAAVNIILPLLGILLAVSLMFATGGNAVIGRFLGEGREHEAREFLTVLYIIGTILGILSTAAVFLFPDQILQALNVSDSLFALSKEYMLSMAVFATPVILQVFTQSFMVTAGKPALGFLLIVFGGLSNILLDYLLISPNIFNLGIAGAGIATGIGNSIPGILGFLYFTFNRKSLLRFTKPKLSGKMLFQSIFNGSSELVGSLATSVTTMMFNVILLSLVGDSGVAAISVILYIQMFQNAIYLGYTVGVSPIISYKYGEGNKPALQKVMGQSIKIIAVSTALVVAATLLLSNQAIGIFISPDSATFDMAKNGLMLFLPAYAFMGFNLFFSAMFTALSNGKVSALISVLRTLVFIVISLLILPQLFDLNGVWLAVPVAEFLSLIVSFTFYRRGKKRYGY